MHQELSRISWRKVGLTLRNTRNTFAREHPLSIFQAVFKTAASLAGWPDQAAWFFHPARQPLGNRMRKGFDYDLELVFPHQDEGEIEAFLGRLRAHLRDPRHNFRLLNCSQAQERDLALLQAEYPALPAEPGELCLDFLTPFPFNPADKKRRWLISRQGLSRAFANRLQRFFGLRPARMEAAWQGVEVLPFFWSYAEHRHRSRSGQGSQYINGMVGPLYLKGELAPLRPLLLLGTELHLGRRLAAGQGFYRLETERPYFDLLLQRPGLYLEAWHRLQADSDSADQLAAFQQNPDEQGRRLREEVLSGAYRPEPARGFCIAKKKGGQRLIAEHAPQDVLVQRVLLEALEPVLDRMFEEVSVGYRRGRSLRTAMQMISRAAAEGFTWVVESDIASCFDSIDWTVLFGRLDRRLPTADAITRGLLRAFITCPLEVGGKRVERSRGLLQGSPLSPLLTNLYLDTFDEELEAKGYCLIRYADDLLVLVRSRAEGQQALADLWAALRPLGLELKEEKTAIRPLGAGVCFLGADLGEELEEHSLSRSILRKTLYLRELHGFLGLDRDSLAIRKEGQSLARVPLRRVDEIVIFGNNGISTRLIHRCSRQNIPISFCSPLGFYVNTLRPDSKRHFRLSGLHAARHAGLAPEEALAAARGLVRAKVANYAAWIKTMRHGQARSVAAELEDRLASLARAESIEALRGMEAAAARAVFGFLNSRVKNPAFASPKRARRKKADLYNALLDFAYFLLFCQVNVMVRGLGLNPYLGVLHSHKDNYESLVSDLMEPFRHRMDRMVLRVVNLKIIGPGDLVAHPRGGYRVGHEALPRFLEAFERELSLWLVEEPAALQDLLAAQVAAVARWAQSQDSLRIFDLSQPEAGSLPLA